MKEITKRGKERLIRKYLNSLWQKSGVKPPKKEIEKHVNYLMEYKYTAVVDLIGQSKRLN